LNIRCCHWLRYGQFELSTVSSTQESTAKRVSRKVSTATPLAFARSSCAFTSASTFSRKSFRDGGCFSQVVSKNMTKAIRSENKSRRRLVLPSETGGFPARPIRVIVATPLCSQFDDLCALALAGSLI